MVKINKIKQNSRKQCLFICRTFVLSIIDQYIDLSLGPTINLYDVYPECIEGWEMIIEDGNYR